MSYRGPVAQWVERLISSKVELSPSPAKDGVVDDFISRPGKSESVIIEKR